MGCGSSRSTEAVEPQESNKDIKMIKQSPKQAPKKEKKAIKVKDNDKAQSHKTIFIRNANADKPALNKKFLRVYGHELDPHTETVRIYLAAKKEQYQFVGVDMNQPPEWFDQLNSCKIPTMETPDGLILGSEETISEWLEENIEKGMKLFPKEESLKEDLKDTLDSVFPECLKMKRILFNAEERSGEGSQIIAQCLEVLNDKLGPSYPPCFFGHHESLVDLRVFPYVHRAFLLKGTAFEDLIYSKFKFDKLEKLKNWYDCLHKKYKDHILKEKDFAD